MNVAFFWDIAPSPESWTYDFRNRVKLPTWLAHILPKLDPPVCWSQRIAFSTLTGTFRLSRTSVLPKCGHPVSVLPCHFTLQGDPPIEGSLALCRYHLIVDHYQTGWSVHHLAFGTLGPQVHYVSTGCPDLWWTRYWRRILKFSECSAPRYIEQNYLQDG
jgi:hypothetical protein